jgi:hypothetical protein
MDREIRKAGIKSPKPLRIECIHGSGDKQLKIDPSPKATVTGAHWWARSVGPDLDEKGLPPPAKRDQCEKHEERD